MNYRSLNHVSPLIVLIGMFSQVYVHPAYAGLITQISSRSAMSPDDVLGWDSLPHPYVALPDSISVNSQNGLTTQVATLGGGGTLFSDQETVVASGNHAPYDYLIGSFHGSSLAGIELTFASPVAGVGTQMDWGAAPGLTGSFVEHMVLFDQFHAVLASFSVAGFHTTLQDDAAVFIGAADSVAEIKSASFFLTADTGGGDGSTIVINRVSLADSVAPEPNTFVLLGGILGITGFLRRLTTGKHHSTVRPPARRVFADTLRA